jgi:hypothetical protein
MSNGNDLCVCGFDRAAHAEGSKIMCAVFTSRRNAEPEFRAVFRPSPTPQAYLPPAMTEAAKLQQRTERMASVAREKVPQDVPTRKEAVKELVGQMTQGEDLQLFQALAYTLPFLGLRNLTQMQLLACLLEGLNEQEQEVLLTTAVRKGRRLLTGRTRYKPLDLLNDPRDFRKEAGEELSDGEDYLVMAEIRDRLKAEAKRY